MTVSVIQGGAKKTMVAPSVVIGGAEKIVENIWVVQSGAKKLAYTRVVAGPWVNQSEGIQASNGTDNHTLPFGFTSTAGNLLVLVVSGNSTNAHTASGWTNRITAGNAFGRQNVLTKISTGDSSVTVTHASNTTPNVLWSIYEFASDYSWAGSTSLSDSTTTWPTLTVTAPDQVVIGSVSRGSLAVANASASAWTGTPNEDVDQQTIAGSAGAFLASAHGTAIAPGTITPAATLAGSFSGSPWVKSAFAVSTHSWDFHASGIAASADPTTVNWGYTAVAGQLLFFVSHGSMTQVNPGAPWTEILNPPVGDCEMSVIRKTAAGGETGVTIDHNGPRPMAWAFWAFPPGSAQFGAGVADLRTDNTISTISGLSGTPKTCIFVFSRPIGPSVAGGSSVWTGPTELFDNNQAGGAQDGAYLTGAVYKHLIASSASASIADSGVFTGNGRYSCGWAVSSP